MEEAKLEKMNAKDEDWKRSSGGWGRMTARTALTGTNSCFYTYAACVDG